MERKFQVKRNKQKNAVGLYDKSRNFNKNMDNITKSQKLMNSIAKWASYYRSRPDVFAEEYLGLSLKPFQKILLYVMIHYNYTVFFASRGLGKSFLTSLYCVVKCILYPGTKIVVAAKTKEQAMVLVSEKIPELINYSKTGMIEREIEGSIRTSMNTPDPNVVFLNGSWIKVVPANQNARSKRANLLILDEFRMIDFSVYKNVLRRFLAVSRQPGFLSKKEYKGKKEYQERNQEIYLSSAWYKFNWSYSRLNIHFKAMLEGKKYFVCGLPYQIAIKENLANEEQLIDELMEDDIDEVGWQMEMDCMFFGESDKAFFGFDDIESNRNLLNPVYPNETYNINIKSLAKPSKKNNVIRIISADIALMKGKQNDASAYSILELVPVKRGYIRKLIYMESMAGGHTNDQSARIMRLYDEFECDYIVLDCHGNGMGIYDQICRGVTDKDLNKDYDPLSCMNDEAMAERCIDPEAPQKIYSVKASSQFNTDIAKILKDTLKRGKLKLLVDENDGRELLFKMKGYNKISTEDKVKLIAPYTQISMLMHEMVNLSNEGKDGVIKLVEPKGGRKDRYSSLAYANYFASELEREYLRLGDNSDSMSGYSFW